MPWLIGGGLLALGLLFANRSTATSPVAAPAPAPVPFPPAHRVDTGPVPIVVHHAAPPAPAAPPPGTSEFTPIPFGATAQKGSVWYWINHYAGSDYKNGESISTQDVTDAVNHAIKTATLSDVNALLAFAVALTDEDYGAIDNSAQLLTDQAHMLQIDAIAPFVEQYANVTTWPSGDIEAFSHADNLTIAHAVANAKLHAPESDLREFGTLLLNSPDYGWVGLGQTLLAEAATPQRTPLPTPKASPPAHHAPAPAPPPHIAPHPTHTTAPEPQPTPSPSPAPSPHPVAHTPPAPPSPPGPSAPVAAHLPLGH